MGDFRLLQESTGAKDPHCRGDDITMLQDLLSSKLSNEYLDLLVTTVTDKKNIYNYETNAIKQDSRTWWIYY